MPDSTNPKMKMIPTPARNMTAVSRDAWVKARKELIEAEKNWTRQRDAMIAARLALPRLHIEKSYSFETPSGTKSLGDLFDGRSQLLLYHFMFGPEWKDGCPGCSFFVDGFDGMLPHLNNHDVTLVAVSRAPLAKIETYRRRMGWHFPWVSSFGSDFNFDFHVSFTPDQLAKGEVVYNYETISAKEANDELPGQTSFQKDPDGRIYQTYDSFSRGGEETINTLMMLDMAPKGRNEQKIFDFVKRHDEYQAASKPAHDCCA